MEVNPEDDERRAQILELLDRIMRETKPAQRRRLEASLAGSRGDGAPTADDLLAQAVRRLPDGPYQEAGSALFSNPELSTANLTERSAEAARLFGQAPDTFRRKDGGRPQILEEMADQILALTKADPAPTDDGTPASSKRPLEHGRGSRRRTAIAFAGGLAAAVLAISLVTRMTADDGPIQEDEQMAAPTLAGEIDVTLHCQSEHGLAWTATPDPANTSGWLCLGSESERPVPADLLAACALQYGDSATPVNGGSAADWRCAIELTDELADDECPVAPGAYDASRADEFASVAGPFRRRYEDAGGQEALGCPATVMHRWSSGIMQEVGTEGETTAGLLAYADQDVVLLIGPSWKAFDRIKGISGTFVGYPIGEPYLSDADIWVTDLTPGGALVAKGPEGPYVWLPPIVYQYWRGIGGRQSCLGFPITDPFSNGTVFRQEFEQGQVVVDPGSASFDINGAGCP